MVVHLALGTWFAKAGVQTQFASIVLNSLVTWRLFLLLSRLYLRPALPAARIAPVGDESAWKLHRLFGFVVLAVVLLRALVGILYTSSAIAAAIVTNSVIVVAIFMVIVILARKDICGWFLGLIDEDARGKSVKAQLARHWLWFAIPLLIALGLARAYVALSDRLEAPISIYLTLDIIVGLLLAAGAATICELEIKTIPIVARTANASVSIVTSICLRSETIALEGGKDHLSAALEQSP
jgi:hypothetical protein